MSKEYVLYICDRRKCENCIDSCKHTTDINHAAHFEKMQNDYIENDEIKNYQQGFRDGLLAAGKQL